MKKVLILFGGNSSEHYISCKSAKSIIQNIDKKNFKYEIVGISYDNKWYKFNDDLSYLDFHDWLDANVLEIDNIVSYIKNFDVVFPITHGTNGEDGKLQGMLDLFNIKYVGCNTLASSIGMDKVMSKQLFKSLNIPQVPYLMIKEDYKVENILREIDFPLIIKPSNGGSSIGISKASTKKELIKGIKEAKKYDNKVLIEKFIKSRELEIAVLQSKGKIIISSPGEINSANEFYDYDAKYANEKTYTTIPDDLPIEVVNKIKEYASKIFTGLDCKGYARIDFFYDELNNEIYVNEINTIPGFTSISMFPKLMQNEGISFSELITILINNA